LVLTNVVFYRLVLLNILPNSSSLHINYVTLQLFKTPCPFYILYLKCCTIFNLYNIVELKQNKKVLNYPNKFRWKSRYEMNLGRSKNIFILSIWSLRYSFSNFTFCNIFFFKWKQSKSCYLPLMSAALHLLVCPWRNRNKIKLSRTVHPDSALWTILALRVWKWLPSSFESFSWRLLSSLIAYCTM